MHYPVRKRGEARRLNPNYPGIHWLERESYDDTEPVIDVITDNPNVILANGAIKARRNGYPRRMFDLFSVTFSGGHKSEYWFPCPACDDWSQTARCADHPDEGAVSGETRERRYGELYDRIDQRETLLAALQIRAERAAERD